MLNSWSTSAGPPAAATAAPSSHCTTRTSTARSASRSSKGRSRGSPSSLTGDVVQQFQRAAMPAAAHANHAQQPDELPSVVILHGDSGQGWKQKGRVCAPTCSIGNTGHGGAALPPSQTRCPQPMGQAAAAVRPIRHQPAAACLNVWVCRDHDAVKRYAGEDIHDKVGGRIAAPACSSIGACEPACPAVTCHVGGL